MKTDYLHVSFHVLRRVQQFAVRAHIVKNDTQFLALQNAISVNVGLLILEKFFEFWNELVGVVMNKVIFELQNLPSRV